MNHEEPDRVPTMSLFYEPAILSQFEGKKNVNYFNYLKNPIIRPIAKRIMNWNWIWNRGFFGIVKKLQGINIELGFDASWVTYGLYKLKKDKEFPFGLAWHDTFGRLFECQVDQFGNPSPYYVRGYCNTEEKWDAWLTEKAHLFKKRLKFTAKVHERFVKEFGKKIFIMGFSAPGIFENCWQPIGFVEFIKYMYEKPRFIEKVIEFHVEYFMKQLEAVSKACSDVIVMSDDLGHKTGPLMNPARIEQYFGPAYQEVTKFIHKQNKKLILHSCGNLYKLLDKFVKWGFDGLLTLEPTASMNLGKVRKIVGHNLVLVGNIDVSYLLVRGTRKEIEDSVKKAIRDAAPGGGYILSPAHDHEGIDPTRIKWVIEAAHEFGQYPIQI
ncbi:MAG: uroporphyrinogen decarboxylase family protein [Promethearchaeota archaeon]